MCRVATFNCENLFARYRFRSNFDPTKADGFTVNDLAFDVYGEVEKQTTARAIKEADADVIALQEVESLPLLDRFHSRYLSAKPYKHRVLIDSFDPRSIDVAVMSRHPVVSVKSHRNERNAQGSNWLFSRDCFEVTVDVDGKPLLLYVNHLKSMIGGRSATRARRFEQAQRVAEIIDERWGASEYAGNFVVLGDLNDYIDEDTALTPLVNHPGLRNVLERAPVEEQWTHYYASGNEYRQLDYLLLSNSLAEHNPAPPAVMRMGLPYRAERYAGPRFDSVGEDEPKASDHALLYMDIDLG